MAGEQRHSERHLSKAQTHVNTHLQDHRSPSGLLPSGGFMKQRWAEMPSALQAGEAKNMLPSPWNLVPW